MKTQKPATLSDLVAWQSTHQKGEDESVSQFLKRRLISHAASLIEEPHATPRMIVDTCKLTGDDPIPLIFGEMDRALTWEEPFRSHFFDDARTWLVETELDELMAQMDRHRALVSDGKRLTEAALEGRLKLVGDGTLDQVAVVRQARATSERSRPS